MNSALVDPDNQPIRLEEQVGSIRILLKEGLEECTSYSETCEELRVEALKRRESRDREMDSLKATLRASQSLIAETSQSRREVLNALESEPLLLSSLSLS
jgi:hypothetical protein